MIISVILYHYTTISVNIFKSPVRLLFDLLHDIKRMDVPLMMVIEFMILLGYDGQLDIDVVDMEEELFDSAVDQLKEPFNIALLKYIIYQQL